MKNKIPSEGGGKEISVSFRRGKEENRCGKDENRKTLRDVS